MDFKQNCMTRIGFIICAVLLFQPWESKAQQKYSLTASQAAELALKNVTDIKNLKLDKEIQIAKNKEYVGQTMPQVSGSAQMQHFFAIPVTLLPDFISPSVYQEVVFPLQDLLLMQSISQHNLVCHGKQLLAFNFSNCFFNQIYSLH